MLFFHNGKLYMVSMLQGISNDNFVEYLNSIERCINGIGSIGYILSSYKLIRENSNEKN